jgi:hypothetical protein
MEKSKLIEVLLTIDAREKRQFGLWLLSPIHNQRTDILALYDFLLSKGTTEINKEAAWQSVQPAEPYDDARMRQVMYFLTKQLEDFLAWQDIQANPTLLELSKLRIYRRRQLTKPFRATLEGTKKMLEEGKQRNSRYLRDISMLEMETYAFKSASQSNQLLNLQETSDALDLAYIAEKLRISCLMLSHKAVYRQVDYQHGTLQTLLTYIEAQDLLTLPAIAVYYHCYMASIDRNNESHFKALLSLITEQREVFPENELRELYLFALNYCIYWSNRGSSDYLIYMFDLYKTGFEDQILFERGIISRFTFFNAVGNAIKIGKFEWAEAFIHQNQQFIEEKYRESIVLISQARLYFEQNELDRAQEVLHNYNSEDLLHVLIAKRLLIKIYFKRREFDALQSLIDSMSIYLRRKESLDSGRQEGYRSFLKVLKKMVQHWPLQQKQRADMKIMIQDAPVILEREWLLAAVEERE